MFPSNFTSELNIVVRTQKSELSAAFCGSSVLTTPKSSSAARSTPPRPLGHRAGRYCSRHNWSQPIPLHSLKQSVSLVAARTLGTHSFRKIFIDGAHKATGGRSTEQLIEERDRALVALLKTLKASSPMDR